LKAKQARPDDEDSAWLEAFAYQLLGDPARAFELAAGARERYGQSTKAASLWLQTAPLEVRFTDLESAIPTHQRSDVDVALGLASAEKGSEANAIRIVANPAPFLHLLL
jgi:hypothetical protein